MAILQGNSGIQLKMIKKIEYFLFVLFLVSCSYNKNDFPEISTSEYDIYATIIDSMFSKSNNKKYIDSKTIAFYKTGPPFGLYINAGVSIQEKNRIENYFDYLVTSYSYNESFISNSTKWDLFNDLEILKNLRLKNIYNYNINKDSLITFSHFEIASSVDSVKFKKVRKESRIIIGFSRVGFNENKNKAIVYSFYYCGYTCASGDYYLLQFKNSKWNIVEKINLGVS